MSAIDDIFKKWNKDKGYQIASDGVEWQDVERIPFSSPRLNYILAGGAPAVGITELSGPESAGKSLIALDLISNAQKKWPDRDTVWFDIETGFDSRWAALQGVNIDKLKYIAPEMESAESIFDMIIQLLSSPDTDISAIVLDSIAALIPKSEFEKDQTDTAVIGGVAKPLTRFCNRVAPLLRHKQCALIVINQVRDDMNSMYGGTVTPGGRGIRHAAMVRLEVRRSDFFNEAGETVSSQAENPAGHRIKVKVLKTKICKPDRKVGMCTLVYRTGLDVIADVAEVGVLLGIFQKKGAWYYAPDENGEIQGYQGKLKFREYLDANPQMLKLYQDKINGLLTATEDQEKADYYKSILEPTE